MTDKTTVLDRLSKRDAQRIEKLNRAHKAREDIVSNESEEYFAVTFKAKSDDVEDMLTQVPTLETSTLPAHFDNLKRELNELQKYVVTSALFLKEFNMRKYLGAVQNLQTKCYELEDQYIPRKKFGFNKKKLSKVADHQKPSSLDDPDCVGKKAANKWDEKLFGFDTRENEVLALESDELYQRDVALRHLKNCTVTLKGVLGTLHITDLDNCVILCGPVTSSVFLERCTNCRIVVACQQLRFHSSTKCDVYLHVTSKGIIEDCSDIRTAPYNLQYDELDKHLSMSGLDKSINNWDRLDDFNWLAPDVPSPNWAVLEDSKRQISWNDQWGKLPS